MPQSSPKRSLATPLPAFTALLKSTWLGAKKLWLPILILTVGLIILGFILQLSFFGTVALSTFSDYLARGGGVNTFELVPVLLELSNISMVAIIPMIILSLLLQIWYHGSIVSVIAKWQIAPKPLKQALRKGFRSILYFIALFVALFIAIAIIFFIITFLSQIVERYTGITDSTVLPMFNRLLLLVFSLSILLMGTLFGFASFFLIDQNLKPLIAIRNSTAMFFSYPWEISWRVIGFGLILYIFNSLINSVSLEGLVFNWQAFLALFYLPLALIFIYENFKVLLEKNPKLSKRE